MDGLQAVQAIKSNPQTAMIPIMMYTSQEGELYVGQARALGAMGVLPKQVRPVDVSKVLYELHLLPERRDMTEAALLPVELEGSLAVDKVPAAAAAAAYDPVVPRVDWGRRIEAAVKDQAVDMRRFIVASLDSFASRIVSDVRDVRDVRDVLPSPPPIQSAPMAAPATQPEWPRWAAPAAVCAIAVLFLILWALARDDLAKSRAQIASLTSANAELNRARSDLTSTVKDLTAALAASPSTGAAPGATVFAASPGTSASRTETVPYGELPFDRGRLDALRDLLARLEGQGFHGVVRITSYAGLFCLTGNPTDGFTPASAGMPAGKCDVIGNPFEEALTGQQRQSLAFANLVAGVRQRTQGQIAVSLASAGSTRPIAPYPARSETLTAGDWNRAAAANNRVEFAAEPGLAP
jgi:CheY-like chemotaxis protein